MGLFSFGSFINFVNFVSMGCINQNLTYCPGSFPHPDSGVRFLCPLRLSCARFTYEVAMLYPERAEMMLEDGAYDVKSSSCILYQKIDRHGMWFPSIWR